MAERHPWEDLDTDIPQPGDTTNGEECGIHDAFDTPPECPTDEIDEPDELNVYDEADDEFEDDDFEDDEEVES